MSRVDPRTHCAVLCKVHFAEVRCVWLRAFDVVVTTSPAVPRILREIFNS